MPCNNNCNQGRECTCDRTMDRATVLVVVILLLYIALGFGVYHLLHENKGQDCAVTVQFKDSKATYIGRTV